MSDEKARGELETLLGREIAVQYLDKAKAPETVTVKKVALRHLGRYSQVVSQDEGAEIAFYTGKGPEWAETLDEDSVNALLEAGRDLNRKRFANFAMRATKFDAQLRQDAPVLSQLADRAASRLPGASNT